MKKRETSSKAPALTRNSLVHAFRSATDVCTTRKRASTPYLRVAWKASRDVCRMRRLCMLLAHLEGARDLAMTHARGPLAHLRKEGSVMISGSEKRLYRKGSTWANARCTAPTTYVGSRRCLGVRRAEGHGGGHKRLKSGGHAVVRGHAVVMIR
eukprot:3592238-Pleurochrysis_carterae.AAC.1